ncbi:MAG: hypothetical protein MK209_09225 [Planctomycetes bacterium]|nr:hypothetical protein [Planctomycetota bacterium]
METTTQPLRHNFGLIETTVIVTVIGITTLFAIPRVEAQGESPIVREGMQYAEWVATHQRVRISKGLDYSHFIEAFVDSQDSLREVPDEFSLKHFEAEGRKHWELHLERRQTGSSFGMYTIVYDLQGFNEHSSTVPRALLPERYRR